MAQPVEQDDQYEVARRRVEARIGFLVHAAVYVVINVVFLIVVGWDFLWATVFWGLGLLMHGIGVFVKGTGKLDSWKERAIAREVARQRGELPGHPQPTAPVATATVPPAPSPPPPTGNPTTPIATDDTVETTKPTERRGS